MPRQPGHPRQLFVEVKNFEGCHSAVDWFAHIGPALGAAASLGSKLVEGWHNNADSSASSAVMALDGDL